MKVWFADPLPEGRPVALAPLATDPRDGPAVLPTPRNEGKSSVNAPNSGIRPIPKRRRSLHQPRPPPLGLAGSTVRFADLFSLASALTILRLILAGILPLFPADFLLAGYLFALATDVLDGPIARRTGRATPAGATLDAWADKALHVNLAWHLVLSGAMPAWWMLAWFSREIVQLPMIPVLIHRWRTLRGEPETTWWGRATAIALAAAVIAVLIGYSSVWLTLLVGVLGLLTGADYGRIHLRPVLRRSHLGA